MGCARWVRVNFESPLQAVCEGLRDFRASQFLLHVFAFAFTFVHPHTSMLSRIAKSLVPRQGLARAPAFFTPSHSASSGKLASCSVTSRDSNSRGYSFSSDPKARPKRTRSGSNGNSNTVASSANRQTRSSKSAACATQKVAKPGLSEDCPADQKASIPTRTPESRPFRAPLPSVPILSTHPSVVRTDAFFSQHRPLLEVTIPRGDRRSALAEERSVKGQGEEVRSSSSASGIEEDGDPLEAFLITEPEGVDECWGEGTASYLAACQPFVPPTTTQVFTPSSGNAPESVDGELSEALDYLTPFGRSTSTRAKGSSSPTPPGHPQDARFLSLQAGRFLHVRLMQNRWKSLKEWDRIQREMEQAMGLKRRSDVKVQGGSAVKEGALSDAGQMIMDKLKELGRMDSDENVWTAPDGKWEIRVVKVGSEAADGDLFSDLMDSAWEDEETLAGPRSSRYRGEARMDSVKRKRKRKISKHK